MESLQGSLLVAGPTIMEGAFRQAVILIAEHGDQGAVGFVVNRPLDAVVGEVAPRLIGSPLFDERIYLGGPVQPEIVSVLGEMEGSPPDFSPIFGSVGSLADVPEAGGACKRMKVIAGYAGWAPGQLEAELAEDGVWLVEPAKPDDVFSLRPETLWREVIRRKGPGFTVLSTMPFDPSTN